MPCISDASVSDVVIIHRTSPEGNKSVTVKVAQKYYFRENDSNGQMATLRMFKIKLTNYTKMKNQIKLSF